ncbi:hypothetical protein QO002_004107 [Pararhizobium capsulatum DSM 1112]|uniref:Uncharacterized protein n=1 Tax=Pararhizobium capsulatum DSM 1112 TaxID=1121113 RepID=A0ABU0BW94_9HYPH|nr:hypothetical protein [Pararhizobium capsulatum DSM 1112]MDQ0320430.1 hypothetical protein [Pararhizobium capsulatum DSM 1112]MDQ0321554.1 hypothetical protein [Pararhizobium capsulatum DSM 1112]MDQ0321969.1 hypothetical protein [Pararhizobium capsulatum DSM 1112]
MSDTPCPVRLALTGDIGRPYGHLTRRRLWARAIFTPQMRVKPIFEKLVEACVNRLRFIAFASFVLCEHVFF